MLLEIKNLRKHFNVKSQKFLGDKKQVKAVDGVSFSISQGRNFALVGESGCGKTTLARLIMKLMNVDSGNIIFDKRDITDLRGEGLRSFRQNIQMVFQDPYSSLDPRFSVYHVLREPMFILKEQFNSKEKKIKAMENVLAAVSLPVNILNRYPHEFSGGERQRIAIARALILKPKLLILDEAVSSLDVIIQKQIIDLLLELQKSFDLTYLFITHNLRVVSKFADYVAVMNSGKIVEMCSREELFANPVHKYTKQLLSAAINYKVSSDAVDAFDLAGEMRKIGDDHFVL